MPYLIFDNEQDAKEISRQAWEQVLGRPKNPEDVTEYLWGVRKHPINDQWALHVSEREDLTPVSGGASRANGNGGQTIIFDTVDELDESWTPPSLP